MLVRNKYAMKLATTIRQRINQRTGKLRPLGLGKVSAVMPGGSIR
jgi:hypothetical protein